VYPLLRESAPDLPAGASPERRGRGVSRNVIFLGLTSLFTDISSEMVSAVLPVYVMFYLRLSPLEFGLVDGLYQGVAAVVRVAGGLAADRWRGYKEVAAIGYGLSAVCKLGLLAAGSAWTALAAVVVLDRTGKGLRTAPRDALISLSSPRGSFATAFGVHRALDTAGALLGPLVAFGLLTLVPDAFDAVFVASFCAAVVGLGVLLLFVENRPPDNVAASVPSLRAAVGLLAAPRYRALVIAGAALGLATIGDGFVYLALQRRLSFAVGFFPLLYVGTALVYLLLAVPMGRLADRMGRERVFVGGYALLLGVYALLLVPAPGAAELVGVFALLGAYYAATDGVLMALASAVLPANLRTSGLALLTSGIGVARLVAAVAFGALWTWRGVETAVMVYVAALVAAILLTGIALARTAGDDEQATNAATTG
jgi:MFS family permease